MGVPQNGWFIIIYNGKPYFLMDDLGGKPAILRKHPHPEPYASNWMIPWMIPQQLSTLRFPSSEPVSDVPGKGHGSKEASEKTSGWVQQELKRLCLLKNCLCYVYVLFFGWFNLNHQPILGKVQCLQYFLLMYQVVFMISMAISVCANWIGVLLGVLSHVVSISRMY